MKIRLTISKRRRLFTKRQRFVTGVLILSSALFLVEHFMGKSGLPLIILLSIVSDIFLYWALKDDMKENFAIQVFILPFFFTLAFGLFYLLVPARLIVKLALTAVYALGIYSVFLSQNIFTVSSISKSIALLSGARTVSFVMTILSYFFLVNVIYSLHLNIVITMILLAISSFPLILQSIWSYTLEKDIRQGVMWGSMLTLCLAEVSFLLWFWPSTPTIIALFLTGFFYIVVGLSHLWFERRLFRSVLWEYIWVALFVFLVLVAFTSWA